MSDLWRGTDTDNWDGAVGVERFRSLYDNHGVRFNIVGCQVGADGANYTGLQIANSEAAELLVPFTYDFPWYAGDSIVNSMTRMRHAMTFGRVVAPDIEAPARVTHPDGAAGMVALMHKVKDLLVSAGQFWGWYSSPSEWARLTGDTQDFAGDLCWSATYPYRNLPPEDYLPDFAQYPAFGGLVPVVWQYANQCYDEPTFDMNAMAAPVPFPPQPAPQSPFVTHITQRFSDGSVWELDVVPPPTF